MKIILFIFLGIIALPLNGFSIDFNQLKTLSDIANQRQSAENQRQSIANQQRQLEIQRQNQNFNFESNNLKIENGKLLHAQKKLSESLIFFTLTTAILNAKNIDNTKAFSISLNLDEDSSKKFLLSEITFCTNVCNKAKEHIKYLVSNGIIESGAFPYAQKLSEVYDLLLLQTDMLKDYVLTDKIEKIKNYDFNKNIINKELGRFLNNNNS